MFASARKLLLTLLNHWRSPCLCLAASPLQNNAEGQKVAWSRHQPQLRGLSYFFLQRKRFNSIDVGCSVMNVSEYDLIKCTTPESKWSTAFCVFELSALLLFLKQIT